MGNTVKCNCLTPAILIIISTIAWIVVLDITSLIQSLPISFWDFANPGFGVIGMFFGAVFAITGYALSKYNTKYRGETVFLPRVEVPMKLPSTPIDSASAINFCPQCGQKILTEAQGFCTNCGGELKKF